VIGTWMTNRMAYNAAGVKATYIPGKSITITTTSAAVVPVTGLVASGGTVYGGQPIASVKLAAGASTTLALTGKLGAEPTITAVTPKSGVAATKVAISGTGFVAGATTVRFGPSPATVLSCTATACSVTAPTGTGTVDVTVTSGGLTSATTAADRFTYTAGTIFVLYGDALASGWQDWSDGVTVNWANTSPVYLGTDSIALTVTTPDGDLEMHSDTGVSSTPYAALTLAVQATQPGANFQVQLFDQNDNQLGNAVPLGAYGPAPVAGFWTLYSIPLADLGAVGKTVGGVMIADNLNAVLPTIYVDQVRPAGK